MASRGSFLAKISNITKNTHKKVRLIETNVSSGGNVSRQIGTHPTPRHLTVGGLFEKWRQKFEKNSISEPKESIGYILAHCLGTTRLSDVNKFKTRLLTPEQIENVDSLCLKRLKNIPIQYVLGEWSFRHLTLQMSPPVFIPRPETEQLIDIILPEIFRIKPCHILDLCCGSGAIGLSLLQEAEFIKVTAVDQSKAACQLTMANAQKNGLNKRIRIIQTQLEQWHCDNKFDVIVSNPPYVFREDLDSLQVEIKLYEDVKALDGGVEGMDVIKTILDISSRCLDKNGKLFLEVEPRHPRLIGDYLENNSLRLILANIYKDFSNNERFLQIIKK